MIVNLVSLVIRFSWIKSKERNFKNRGRDFRSVCYNRPHAPFPVVTVTSRLPRKQAGKYYDVYFSGREILKLTSLKTMHHLDAQRDC